MNPDKSGVVEPDDVLSESQLDKLGDEPDKYRLHSPGHETWVYDDATVVSGGAYSIFSNLVDGDVMEEGFRLSPEDVERLYNAAVELRGTENPVAWFEDNDDYRHGGFDELPVQVDMYFGQDRSIRTELRSSEDLVERLDFLGSPEDDKDREENSGLEARVREKLSNNYFAVPMIYSRDGVPMERQPVAVVYRQQDSSDLTSDFDKFVEGLEGSDTSTINTMVEGASAGEPVEDEQVDISSEMPERPAELRDKPRGEGYVLNFDAREYDNPDEINVNIGEGVISILDHQGEELTSRDVEFDEEIEPGDLEDLELDDLNVNNGVGTATFI